MENVYEDIGDQNLTLQLNESLNFHDSDNDDLAYKIIQTVLLEVIYLIGIFGSIITCLIVIRKRNSQISLNIFLGTLAIGDLLFCLENFIVCPTYSLLIDTRIFGKDMCLIAYFIDEFHEYYSILIISTAICLYLCHDINLKMTFGLNIIVVLFSIIIPLFTIKYTHQLLTTDDGHQYCIHEWPNDTSEKALQLSKFFINIVLPFIIIVVSSVLRFCFKIGEGNASSSRLLLVVMIIHILLWNPLPVVSNFTQIDLFAYHFVLNLLSQLTIVYKPIVYYGMNHTFKKEFLNLISKCFKTNRPQRYNVQHVNMNM